MPFIKGQKNPNAGRPAGSRNKITAEIKQVMFECFDPKDFKKWAKKNPDSFYQIMTKILPKDIEAQGLIKLVIMDCLKDAD